MKTYLSEFFSLFDYDTEAQKVLVDAYERVVGNAEMVERFNALLSAYDANIDLDYSAMIEEMSSICKTLALEIYTGHLLLFICLSRRLRECYREKGIDRTIWHQSMLDLKYKLEECYLMYGIRGTFVASWFSRFFDMTRFALGRLQFEIIPFDGEFDRGDIHLTPSSPVINVHIPRAEIPLTPERVWDAYDQAARFFEPLLNGAPVVFHCRTWLFFEQHRNMLSPNTNICRFMNDYTMLQTGEYEDYSQVWRLFDCNYTGDPEALPADSSLRRAYIDLIKRGEPTGWGKGIIIYSARKTEYKKGEA